MIDKPSTEFRYGWINVHQAMEHLGIPATLDGKPNSAIYRLIDQYQLPYGRLGRLYRFRRVDLDEWVTRNTVTLAAIRRA